MKRQKRRQMQGFTLLELLMVVIIIAILASIALPQYLRVAERSRAAEALTNLATIRSSEERYRAATGSTLGTGLEYTTDLSLIDIDVPKNAGPGCSLAFGTPNWCFTVDGSTLGNHVVATRTDGSGDTIKTVLDTGVTCASNVNHQVGSVLAATSAGC